MEELGILELYIPELVKAKKYFQPEYHADNVFVHSLKTMDMAEDKIKIAALLHDIGKIETQSEDEKGIHFYGHDIKGAEMAKEILTRLKFPKKEIIRVGNLIRWHMFYYPSGDWRRGNEIANIEDVEDGGKITHGWSDAAIRRFIKNIGGEDVLDDLFRLRIADAGANPKSSFSTDELDVFENRVARVREMDMALKVTDLVVSGKELIKLGYQPGPQFTKILEYLLDVVIQDPSKNQKQLLIDLVKSKYPLK